MLQIKGLRPSSPRTLALAVILLTAGIYSCVEIPQPPPPPTTTQFQAPSPATEAGETPEAESESKDTEAPDASSTAPKKPAEVPSYYEIVESEFYATGAARPGGGDVLTASDLQVLFETRVEFDDPSHHGGLYSSQRLATRSELELLDRRLVALSKSTAPRPPGPVVAHEAKRPSNGWQEAPGDKTLRDFDPSCLRSGCHQEYTRQPWVHAPVAVGSCDSCHVPDPTAADEHRFQPTLAADRLCSECHKHPRQEKFEHAGYKDTDCTRCHDPHGGSNPNFLITLDQRVMCGQCHDQKFSNAPAADPGPLHKPFAEGQCLECHAAHRANNESLTILPAGELCLSCHQEFIEQFPSFLTLHKPVKTECGSCHLPHGGSTHLIRSMSLDLCLGCHEDVAHSLTQNTRLHTAIKEAKSCLDCHVPHASYTKNLLKGRVGRMCVTCHDKVIETDSGEDLQNIKELLLTKKYRHAPALEGQCQECHVSHSLENQRLLFAKYPTNLYAEGSKNTYRLCLKCHDERMLLEEQTVATRFRDGTRNLHRVHVLRKKGRTCNICHEVHAADVPRLMRSTIPFGSSGYTIQVGFQTTDSGGSCGPNCHYAMSYTNTTPPGADSLMRYQLETE